MTNWISDPIRVKEILDRISPSDSYYGRYLAKARKVDPETIRASAGLKVPPSLGMWESKTFRREFLVAEIGTMDEVRFSGAGFPKAFMLPGHITGVPVIFTPKHRKESKSLWTGMMEHECIHVAQDISQPSRKSNPSSPNQDITLFWRKVQLEAEAYYLERAFWRPHRDTKDSTATLESYSTMLAIESGVRAALHRTRNPLLLFDRLCETPPSFEEEVRKLGVQESLVSHIAGYVRFCANEIVMEKMRTARSSTS